MGSYGSLPFLRRAVVQKLDERESCLKTAKLILFELKDVHCSHLISLCPPTRYAKPSEQ